MQHNPKFNQIHFVSATFNLILFSIIFMLHDSTLVLLDFSHYVDYISTSKARNR